MLYKIYSEDFSSGKLEESIWNIEVGNRWSNNEFQAYTNRPENIFIENGCLHIRAIKEDYQDRQYTSGRINTKDKLTFQYGKIEVTAKLPNGIGTWPAIWLLKNTREKKGWPLCGEIDIMEYTPIRKDILETTIHTKKYNHKIGTQIGKKSKVPNLSNGFHKFGLEWSSSKLTWFLDEKEYFSVEKEPNANEEAWPFDEPFFLVINQAVGGWFVKNKVDDSCFPQDFIIQKIEIYEEK